MYRAPSWLIRLVARALGAVAISIVVVASGAQAVQAQVPKTVRIIVPFPAGGSADILARVLGEQAGKASGPTMVIENRPGAGASIGYEVIARAPPDGSTIGIISNSFVINPLVRKVGYDPFADFAPICHLVDSPQVIVVNAASSYQTLGGLIAAAHAKPGELTFAALGPAATQHIAVEQLKLMAKADFTYVPYPGGAPATTALLGGHVTALLENYSEAIEQMKAGKLRALAVTTPARMDSLPNVPTVAESGYPGYAAEAWFGVAAPAKTPKEALDRLAAAFTESLKAPEVTTKLLDIEMIPAGTCGSSFAAQIRSSHDSYSEIIRDAHISAE
jgi:tripartite-type tricarboxylate transporter receptor subunit TctC